MNAPDKLTITLSPQEKTDIAGWVNFLRANPQYIGVPRPADPLPPPLPGGGFPWQTRIVLAEQTRARFDEITAQFVSAPPAPPPSPDPLGPLGRFDAAPSDWAAWAFITDAERTALKDRYPAMAVQIDNLVQFYAGGSAGGLFIPKRRDADGAYYFGKLDGSVPDGVTWTRDVLGAADEYVGQRCDAQGIPRPGHLR